MRVRCEGRASLPHAGRRPRWLARAAALMVLLPASALAPLQAAQAAHSNPPFVPGEASALSQTVQVAPRTGGLSAAITVGTSIADYRASLGQASSQTLNLGVIGSTLTVQCDASPPALTPGQLPQPLLSESDHGNSHATATTAGSGKSGLAAAAGKEAVRTTTQPQATATFDGNAIAVPGVLAMSGLHSQSHARLIPHTARIATAQSRVGTLKLLGGAIVLSGLRWTATQRTGKGRAAAAQFSIDSAVIAGKHLPVTSANLKATAAKLNKSLSATGIHLTLPQRTLTHGKISETPLTIGIDNSQFGNKTINPLLGAIQPVTNAALNALVGINCKIGSLLSAVDLLVSGVDGTGGLDLNLGGASAASDGKTYSDPFGSGHTPQLGHQQHAGGGHHASSPTAGSSGGSGPSGGASSTTTAGQTTGAGTTTNASESTTVSDSCSTLSPAGRPGCSRGAGLKVGLVALALLAAFAAADAVVLAARRRAAAAE